MALQETWLHENSSHLDIPGFVLIRNDRRGRHGGTAVYCKQSLRPQIIKDLTIQANSPVYEQQVIKLCITTRVPLFLCNVYCPDRQLHRDAIDNLEALVAGLLHNFASNSYVIVGDLNIDGMQHLSNQTNLLKEFCSMHNLTSHMNLPTRISRYCQSQLDYVISSSEVSSQISNCSLVTPCPSDHLGISFTFNLESTKQTELPVKEMRIYKNFDREQFCGALEKADWSDFLTAIHSACLEDSVSILERIILLHLDKVAPIKSIHKYPHYAPWVNNEIRNEIKKRNKLHYRAMTSKIETDWKQYKTQRNNVTYLIRKARHNYNNHLFLNASSLEDTWKLIQKLVKPSRQHKCQATSVQELDTFNDYFASVGASVHHRIHDSNSHSLPFFHNIEQVTDQFTFHEVTELDIIRAVGRLPSWGAPGIDGINGFVLKSALPVICPHITELVNLSIRNSTFPSRFKKAIVVPVPKVAGATAADEHRPISLLTLISKVIERVIYNQLYTHISPYLSSAQHGFRRHTSTESALLRVTDSILQSMDNRNVSIMVLLDLSKAFDSVQHHILLEKLSLYGLSPSSLLWIRSYLSNRSQFVKVGQLSSSTAAVSCGVPQGSILGPLLFLIFTNDLSKVVKNCCVVQFADDTQLLSSFNPKSKNYLSFAEGLINCDLHNIYEWCCSNSLLINSSKSKVMAIGQSRILSSISRLPTLTINKQELEYATTAKTLEFTSTQTCLSSNTSTL